MAIHMTEAAVLGMSALLLEMCVVAVWLAQILDLRQRPQEVAVAIVGVQLW